MLAWAVEFDHIPIAVRNWLALRQEERWWLFGHDCQHHRRRQ